MITNKKYYDFRKETDINKVKKYFYDITISDN